MELIVGGLILTQIVGLFLAYKYNRSMLNAVIAKTPHEFQLLEKAPRRKVRRPEPVQDDAGIPIGL